MGRTCKGNHCKAIEAEQEEAGNEGTRIISIIAVIIILVVVVDANKYVTLFQYK
jgi:hypothetical protein